MFWLGLLLLLSLVLGADWLAGLAVLEAAVPGVVVALGHAAPGVGWSAEGVLRAV